MGTKQIIPLASININYGAYTGYLPYLGGGDFSLPVVFGEDLIKSVIPIAGTISKLYASATPGSNGLPTPEFTLTLRKNGIDTGLTVTVPAGGALTIDLTHSVSVTEFDDLSWKVAGTIQSATGYLLFISTEFDPASNNQSIYGFGYASGTILNGAGFFGGAFNNGVPQQYIGQADSGTYSICAAAGNITKLTMKTKAGAPGAGIWTGYVLLNGVLQDGSGGTVDTSVVITGSDTEKSSTFTLPVVPTDHVNLVYVRSGSDAPYALIAGCAMSCVFTGAADFTYMFCGGNNNTIYNSGTNYLWVNTAQLASGEQRAANIVGGGGCRVTGFYGELGPTGSPRSYTWTVRKTGVDTALSFEFANTIFTESRTDTGDVTFLPNDTIDVAYTAVNTPNASNFFWGIRAVSDFPVVPTSGIYKMVPGKTNDTIYIQNSPPVTTDVKIPDPFAITALYGDEP